MSPGEELNACNSSQAKASEATEAVRQYCIRYLQLLLSALPRKDLHSEAVSWQNDGCYSRGIREYPRPFRLCLLWANGFSTSFWYSFVSFIPNGAIATTLTAASLISRALSHIRYHRQGRISFVLHDKGILEGQKCRYKSPGSSLDVMTSLTSHQQMQLKGQHQCLVCASGMPEVGSSIFSHYYFWL